MIPRNWERAGGLFIALAGGWVTYFAWQAAHQQHSFLSVGAAGPGFVLIGLGLLAFPGYRSERIARGESLDGLEGWALITPRWRFVAVLAMVLSAAYFFVLTQGP